MLSGEVPPFRPHPFLWNGHLQTLALLFHRPDPIPFPDTELRFVTLDDGDAIALHDDCPPGWATGCPTVLMLHGLGGSHRSLYLQRIARKLFDRGVRTFRMDMRICGAAAGSARKSYHAGLTNDLRAAIREIRERISDSPLAGIGFSLGGNLLLRMLGENGGKPDADVDAAIAVCPPLDLGGSVRHLRRGIRKYYDRRFVTMLMRQLERNAEKQGGSFSLPEVPTSLYDFDRIHTAAVWGFASADDYYAQCSCGPVLEEITVPTVILASRDDPMIPAVQYEQAEYSSLVRLHLARRGGHMGFIGRRGQDPDRYWMDGRVVDWVFRMKSWDAEGLPSGDTQAAAIDSSHE